MSLKLPEAFSELLVARFNSAVASTSLKFAQSSEELIKEHDFTFKVRIAPSLAMKPVKNEDTAGESPIKKKLNPFLNPEPELFLSPLGDRYSLILNKFSILPYHFLCITKEFESQNTPLSEDDLEAAWRCLDTDITPPEDITSSTGVKSHSRWMAFYNCGSLSGASQEHKHIQFIPVDSDVKLVPDVILELHGNSGNHSKDAIGESPVSHPDLKFSHFVLPLPRSPTPEDLAMRFSSLLSRTLTTFRLNEQKEKSFNFVMTKEWMFIAPRSKETYEDISINSTGMAGLLLAKSEDQFNLIKQIGPLELTGMVGLPMVHRNEDHSDY
ncbi:ATP adenylyltransferase-domain-containing protein [Dipodascopsis uninucleata]